MKKLLLTIAGFAAGSAIVVGTAAALGGSGQSATPAAAPTMPSTLMVPAAATTTKKLTIQHVQKGCHVWSDGTRRAAVMRLTLSRGTRLTITDLDIDPHQLLQVSGPRLGLRGHMMMGGVESVVFKQSAVYQLKTKTVEMGPMMDTKTDGPDNALRLIVRVA